MGAAGLAPAVASLLENVGWQSTFWIVGIVGGTMVFLVVPFFRNRPVDIGIRPYGAKDDDPPELVWSEEEQKLRLKVFNQHIRKTHEFWNLPLIHGLGCVGHGIILIYSIPIARRARDQPHRSRPDSDRDQRIQHRQSFHHSFSRRANRWQAGYGHRDVDSRA